VLNLEDLAIILLKHPRDIELKFLELLLFMALRRIRAVVWIEFVLSCESIQRDCTWFNEMCCITAVGVLQMMSQHMSMQVWLLIESFMTPFEATQERFLACMDPKMSFQIEI
jgi:hypothetical protein